MVESPLLDGNNPAEISLSDGDFPGPETPREIPPEIAAFFSFEKICHLVPDFAKKFSYPDDLKIVLDFFRRFCSQISEVDYSQLADENFQRRFYSELLKYTLRHFNALIGELNEYFGVFRDVLKDRFSQGWQHEFRVSILVSWIIHYMQERKGEFAWEKRPALPASADSLTPGQSKPPAFYFTPGSKKYIDHPVGVVHDLALITGVSDPQTFCVGALHDVREDIMKGFIGQVLKIPPERRPEVLSAFDHFVPGLFLTPEQKRLRKTERRSRPKNPPVPPLPHTHEDRAEDRISISLLLDLVSKDKTQWPSAQLPRARAAHELFERILALPSHQQAAVFDTIIRIRLSDRLRNQRSVEFLKENKQLEMTDESRYIYIPIAALLQMSLALERLQDSVWAYDKGIGYDSLELLDHWAAEQLKLDPSQRIQDDELKKEYRPPLLILFQELFHERMRAKGFIENDYVLQIFGRPARHTFRRKSHLLGKLIKRIQSGRAFAPDPAQESFARELRHYLVAFPRRREEGRHGSSPSDVSTALGQTFREIFSAPADFAKFSPDQRTPVGRILHFGRHPTEKGQRSFGIGAYTVFPDPYSAYLKLYGNFHGVPLRNGLSSGPILNDTLIQNVLKIVESDQDRLSQLFGLCDEAYGVDPSGVIKGCRSRLAAYFLEDQKNDRFSLPPELFARIVKFIDRQSYTRFAEKVSVTVQIHFMRDGQEISTVSKKINLPRGSNCETALLNFDPFLFAERPLQSYSVRRFLGTHPFTAFSNQDSPPDPYFSLQHFDVLDSFVDLDVPFATGERSSVVEQFLCCAESNLDLQVFPQLDKHISVLTRRFGSP